MPDPNNNQPAQPPIIPTGQPTTFGDDTAKTTAAAAPVTIPTPNANGEESPMPDFQSAMTEVPPLPKSSNDEKDKKNPPGTESAGGGSPDDIPPVISSTPKKKFGSGRIIATILGVIVLVGGIGAGLVLTFQPQLFQQRAFFTEGTGGGNYLGDNPGNVAPPRRDNEGGGGGGSTVNYATDVNNCGSAGHKCSTGDLCSGGVCFNPLTDSNNCGAAGHKCSTGDSCADGQCVNLMTSSSNCGSVGHACQTGYECQSGVCTVVPNSQCGRNNDLGAPVCCDAGTRASCSNPTCEQGRKECIVGGKYCTIEADSADCKGANPTEPPSLTQTASCQNIKAYTTSWTLLSNADLNALSAGDKVNFCVLGAASSGTFDMARFTINSVQQATTTVNRPGTNDYCQDYTIPSGVSSFDVSAQVHHTTLGWK